jgi:hypothetical protein
MILGLATLGVWLHFHLFLNTSRKSFDIFLTGRFQMNHIIQV